MTGYFLKFLKNLFVLCLFSLFFSFKTSALTVTELSSVLKAAPNLQADYIQEKTLKKLNRVLKSSGHIVIIDNRNVFLRQNEPFNLEQIITPKVFAQLMDDEVSEISKENNPKLFEISNLLLNIFSMSEFNEQYFSYMLTGDTDSWTLQMAPNDELLSKIFKKISIEGSDKVKKIVIEDVSDDTTTLIFSDYRTDNISLNTKEQSYLVK